jgi:sucrose phosphorylase
MQLITYADRLAGNLQGLRKRLDTDFEGLFTGVHVLPFFDPIDGADAGFDPVDHTQVDPRLGDWSDVRDLAADYSVMADLIVNHVSAASLQFEDVKRLGKRSAFWDLFLKKTDLFPASDPDTAMEITRIYRPRPGLPFTPINVDDEGEVEFWTTFSPNQLDINIENAVGRAYLDSILERFADAGIQEVRLDAAGYAVKRRGTSCFMLPETFEFIAALSQQASRLGIDTLVEIHSHYETQIAIAATVGRVYDFALPPLVLHALYTGNANPLKHWLAIAPRNCVTVLDTHDGIGIVDVAREGKKSGLLSDDQIDYLVDTIHQRTGGGSLRASGHAASNLDVYQVNSTIYDALGRSDREYLIARAIQFFAPGTPQVYYVGLLAGENDLDLVEHTGVGRDINRHYYTDTEIGDALERPVVDSLIRLMKLRKGSSAFDGEFAIGDAGVDRLIMRWNGDDASAELNVDLGSKTASMRFEAPDGPRHYEIADSLTERKV